MSDLNTIVIEEIIRNNFDIVTLAWSSGMAWWLSASAFCLALITKLYPSKEDFKAKGYHLPIGIFVSMFLASMILFGCVTLFELSSIERVLYMTFIDSCLTIDFPDVTHIFSLVQKLYMISTSTMVVFLLSWVYVWFSEKPFKILSGGSKF